ncbi:CHAT domain-containing tetratricopeptide repeat protein [Pedobacter sp. JY14-1]|uniref:CHAT domain-containing protein n=1 Tax=Pedobacter sp. JY14-1 TaxID=3034151 RepID=UPI0023E1A0EF|nr:CHAT domain-containing tetratricopeptide repeat protein [Pedobacter sp. JY14-1]
MKIKAGLVSLLLCLLLFPATVVAQCPTDSIREVQIAAIHGGTAPNGQKIAALKKLQQEILKCGRLKNRLYALLLHRIGDMYGKNEDLENAMRYTRQAALINASGQQDTDPAFLTNSYFNLAIFCKRLHLARESQFFFDRCIAAGSAYPDKHFIVFMAFEQKAYALYQTGDYQQSTEVAAEGLRFARETGNTKAIPGLLAQYAQSSAELQQYLAAETHIRQAIALLEKAGDDPLHLATCYSVNAELQVKKKQPEEALVYYKKAFTLNQAHENAEQCSRDLLDMGSVYTDELGQHQSALSCYREGLKLAQQTGDRYQQAGLYSNMGVVYGRQNNYALALCYYQKALNALPIGFSNTSLHANPSPEMLKLAANDYFATTIIANKANALLQLYRQRHQVSYLHQALTVYELADQAIDIMRWKQQGQQSKLIWRQKTKEVYEKSLETCFELKDGAKAYYFFEKSRAALLNDQLSSRSATSGLSPADQQQEKALRVRAAALSSQLQSGTLGAREYAARKTSWLKAQQTWEQFISGLEKRYPTYYQQKYDRSVYPLKKLKSQLGRDRQSLVEYFNGQSAIFALVLTGKGQELVRISYPGLAKDTRQLMRLVSDASLLNQQYPKYARIATALYQRLFQPLKLAPGRVIISADEVLFPFEALLSNKKVHDSFLAKKYIFSYIPAVRILMKARGKTRSPEDKFLGIAPVNDQRPDKGSTDHLPLPSLKGSDLSLRRIAARSASPLLLTGKSATRNNFLAAIPGAGLLQIYAHADADEYQKQPRIYLADTAIYLAELEKQDLSALQLVVLSACNTGVGRNARGEGIFSLARGCMNGGATSVVTNLWQASDQATYRLTESFYRNLREGLPKDEALYKARLQLMDDPSGAYALPSYWATAILIGDSSPLIKASKVSGLEVVVFIVILFVATVAVAAGFSLLRKAK